MNISAIIGIYVTETAQIKKSIYLNWRDSPYSRFGFVLFYCYAHSFFMQKKNRGECPIRELAHTQDIVAQYNRRTGL